LKKKTKFKFSVTDVFHPADAAINVAPGFSVSALNLTTNFGAGELYIQDFTAENLNVVHHG
jgi:hypothetical protein